MIIDLRNQMTTRFRYHAAKNENLSQKKCNKYYTCYKLQKSVNKPDGDVKFRYSQHTPKTNLRFRSKKRHPPIFLGQTPSFLIE